MPIRFVIVALVSLLSFASAQAAEDVMIGDVPIPADAAPTPRGDYRFSGVWTGTWGGQINHIFIVENVRSDGVATVIYAIGENGSGPGRWMRTKAQIDGDEIVVEGNGFTARYRLSPTGRLRAVFGEDRGFAILKQRTLGALKTAPTLDWWSIGELAPLITGLIEDDRPVRLNAVLYPPE
ncbi:MAG: hypothetical protein AAFU55_10050, partial [Pseudomonadota bacterium]